MLANSAQFGCLCYLTLIWHFNVKRFYQMPNNNNVIVSKCVWIDRSLTWAHELIIKILRSAMINRIWFESSSFTIVNSLRDLLGTCNFVGLSSLRFTKNISFCCRNDESYFIVPRTRLLAIYSRNMSIVLYSLLDCATISFNIHTRLLITKPI